MDWKLYATIVFVCVAVGSFFYKRAQLQGIRVGSFMVVQSLSFFLVVSAAGLLRGGPVLDNPYVALGAVAGTLGMAGAFSTLTSMGKGELGPNLAVVRLSFIPTVACAVLFLGEPITPRKGLLLVLAALAVFLFFDHYRRDNRPGLGSMIPALAACVAFGLFDALYKLASNHGVDPLTFLAVQSGTAHILINLYVAIHEKYAFNKTTLGTGFACGLLFAAGCLSMFKAVEQVDVSLISPFIQMNFVLSYLLAVVFLGESVTRRKLLGIALVVGSLLLMSRGM